MRALLDDDQTQFADALARFAEREYSRGPAAPQAAFEPARHARLAGLGCLSLAIPEALGGFGGGVEIMLAASTLAPTLMREPFVATGLRAAALLSDAAPEAQDLLSAMATGQEVVIVATGLSARRDAAGWRLDGAAAAVAAAPLADSFLVLARDETGATALFHLPSGVPGLRLTPRRRMDGLPAADLTLEHCRVADDARLAANVPGEALARVDDLVEMAEIAEMVGLMQACLAATVEYLRTRRQFGAAIGSFQALQHRVADMAMALEETRSLAYAAALACAAPAAIRRRTLSMAKICACDAAQRVGAETIQMHGAIGMTDELIVSHWFRRLLALRHSSGQRRDHLARLAADI